MASTYKELNDLATDRQIYDFTEEVNKLDAKINPLTVLTNQIGKRGSISSVKHIWYQEELDNRWDTLADAFTSTSAATTSETTMSVTTGSRFHKWDVIKLPENGWVGIVCDAPSATGAADLTVSAINTVATTEGDTAAGENILIMGPAIEEGSGGVDAYQGTVTERYNYTTTLQRAFAINREVMVNAMHGGDELARLQNKKGREAARDMELYLWHGIRSEATGVVEGNSYQRYNGGIFYFLTGDGDGNATNTNIGGALTESAFQSWLFDCFKYTDTLYLFCGEYGLQAIDNWARGKLKMLPKDKSYGLNITEYPLAGRMAYIVDATRILEQGAATSGTDYDGYIVALDLADIKFFWYKGEEMKLHTAVQPAKEGLNRREDVYQGQFTLEVGNAKRHGVAYGITGIG